MLQKLLKDPVIQQCRLRATEAEGELDDDGFITQKQNVKGVTAFGSNKVVGNNDAGNK